MPSYLQLPAYLVLISYTFSTTTFILLLPSPFSEHSWRRILPTGGDMGRRKEGLHWSLGSGWWGLGGEAVGVGGTDTHTFATHTHTLFYTHLCWLPLPVSHLILPLSLSLLSASSMPACLSCSSPHSSSHMYEEKPPISSMKTPSYSLLYLLIYNLIYIPSPEMKASSSIDISGIHLLLLKALLSVCGFMKGKAL